VIKTGNQALDIVLMEKGLFCKNHNIQWTCMADGFQLDFMKNEDIYAIFGNAFDNAISAVQKVEEDKRVIGVKMINQNNLLTIQIQNYFNGELEFVDGLPKTTQENKRMHGYGMKSIRYTAEKYFGTITVNTESDIFMLQILIPIPS
jgi:sensor histidine kinase regulating citrate/malate metabolism